MISRAWICRREEEGAMEGGMESGMEGGMEGGREGESTYMYI